MAVLRRQLQIVVIIIIIIIIIIKQGKSTTDMFCSQSFSVRGLTASWTTIFHNCLLSTIRNSSSIVNPIQSLILPNQLVLDLPLVQAPSVVPWIISFA